MLQWRGLHKQAAMTATVVWATDNKLQIRLLIAVVSADGFQAEIALFEHDTVDENTEHLMKLHIVCLEVLKLEKLAMGWCVDEEVCTCSSTPHPAAVLIDQHFACH